jgi:hypothetical protein
MEGKSSKTFHCSSRRPDPEIVPIYGLEASECHMTYFAYLMNRAPFRGATAK